MKHTSYLSIGSNLGNRILNCQIAINNLREFYKVLIVSSFYETFSPLSFPFLLSFLSLQKI